MAGNVNFSGEPQFAAPRSAYKPPAMDPMVNMQQFGLKQSGPQPDPTPKVKYSPDFKFNEQGGGPSKPTPNVQFSNNFKFSAFGVVGKNMPNMPKESTLGPMGSKVGRAYKIIEGAEKKVPNQGGHPAVKRLHPSKHAGKLAIELARAASA